jgi:alpha-amylase/alpha-mannosidase (GH57 family)
MEKPLYIMFLWHMHQPYYKDPLKGEYLLPWVRLHGIKDYYDMVAILRDFPEIHQTFNLVPSLLEQIEDYTKNKALDKFMHHTLIPADSLTLEEKVFILHNFFLAHWDNMIKVYPRYHELLAKRGYHVTKKELDRTSRYFSKQDFLDLQVWFNLCWFDPLFRERDPFLIGLIKKDKNFTEEEKRLLIEKQMEILELIIPEYKKMEDLGQIEISTSPYFHPILPLLYDTSSARVAMPLVKLPHERFSHPEDVEEQISRAVLYHEKIFGRRSLGMWPSEGSVSQEILPLISKYGIKWIASDEGILSASLGIPFDRDFSGITKNPEILYKAYLTDNLSIVFRDHTLSDLIGFVYSKWDPKNAVDDFIARLHKIREGLSVNQGDHIVSIILDGENAWEHYRNDGRPFLLYLYERLSSDPLLKTVTMEEYLNNYPPKDRIKTLFSGSWINRNFAIWIGHEEDNTAWGLLSRTRRDLVEYEGSLPQVNRENVSEAWREIYVAEGSDWCWWYGDEHSTENAAEFDELFRSHLMKIYNLIGKEIPPDLLIPVIKEDRKFRPTVELTAFISPVIDGEVTNYYEWLSSAYLDVSKMGGTMHRAESIISHIYYGFDLKNIFLRLDTTRTLKDPQVSQITFTIRFLKPGGMTVEINCSPADGTVRAVLVREIGNHERHIEGKIPTIAAHDIIELALPFSLLNVKELDEVAFIIVVKRDDSELEKWPYKGYFSFNVPTPDFEAIMWQV